MSRRSDPSVRRWREKVSLAATYRDDGALLSASRVLRELAEELEQAHAERLGAGKELADLFRAKLSGQPASAMPQPEDAA